MHKKKILNKIITQAQFATITMSQNYYFDKLIDESKLKMSTRKKSMWQGLLYRNVVYNEHVINR